MSVSYRYRRRTDMVPSYPGWSFNRFYNNNRDQSPRPEWKYYDYALSNLSTTSTGVFFCLNGMQLGSSVNQRIGSVINIVTYELRVRVVSTGASPATTAQHVRYIVFYDKQANAQTPSIGPNDLLQTADYTVSSRGMNQRRRYRIIMDKVLGIGSVTSGPVVEYIHKYIKFRRPLNVQYNGGNNGDQSDIVTNTLWLLVVSSNSVATGCVYSINSRIRFVDS